MGSNTSRAGLVAAICLVVAAGALAASGDTEQPAAHEEEILAAAEREKGFRPPALLLISGRPQTLERFMGYARGIFEGGPLSAKEAYLVALASAVALKSPVCIRAHAASAAGAGATRDEVLQTALIAGVVSGTSPLHAAFEAAEAFTPPPDGDE